MEKCVKSLSKNRKYTRVKIGSLPGKIPILLRLLTGVEKDVKVRWAEKYLDQILCRWIQKKKLIDIGLR